MLFIVNLVSNEYEYLSFSVYIICVYDLNLHDAMLYYHCRWLVCISLC